MKSVVLIGAGARGLNSYANYMNSNNLEAKVIAVVEPDDVKRKKAQKELGIEEKFVFSDEKDLYDLGKIADGAIIANQDKDHFYSVMTCLDLGYDILLEKPITPSPDELEKIHVKVQETGGRIMVCHVLRYTPFFYKLKTLMDSKAIGEIVGIDHTENIGNYHMAHSFVRGNWGNSEKSSPIILAKSCHDMDLITWLVGSKYKSIYSRGKLKFFKEENAPEESTFKCKDCSLKETCNYSAKKFYLDALPGGWINNVTGDNSYENVEKILETTNYGTCVYKVDNDVCDHTITVMEFENDIDVTFTLTAFTNDQSRLTRVFGTTGSITADTYTNEIRVKSFVTRDTDEQTEIVFRPEMIKGGHGGGDQSLVNDFVRFLNDKDYEPRTSIDQSIQSHNMCYDSEKSRLQKKIVDKD